MSALRGLFRKLNAENARLRAGGGKKMQTAFKAARSGKTTKKIQRKSDFFYNLVPNLNYFPMA